MKSNIFTIQFLFCLLFCTNAFSQSLMEWQKNIIHNNSGRTGPKVICVGDINGDGMNDIVTGDTSSGISWFKSIDGNGSFGSSKFVVDASGSFGISDIYISDMDGDGFNDIVFVNTLSYWVKNIDGNGNFGTPILLSTTSYQTYGLQVIDIDNDGDFDIVQSRVTSSPSFQIELLKNNGNGTFATPIVIAGSSSMLRFTVTDINGDTLPDLVFEGQSAVLYYQQNSNNTFSSTFTENMGSTSNHMTSGIFNMGNIIGGDIDGDGDIDIVNVYQNGSARSIRWFRNDNNVFANSQVLVNIPSDNGSSNNDYFTIRLSDLDNDGKVDIIIQNSFMNSITWYKNLGNNSFGPQQIISNTVLQNKDVVIVDINGDTKLDVITPDHTNNVIKWFDNIYGNATSFIQNTIDDYISLSTLTAVGDIDGNGTKDVMIASRNTSKLAWLSNTNGLGVFSEMPKNITTSLQSYTSAILIDANNDGYLDIVVSSASDTTNKIVWLANDGQGNFSNEQLLYTSNIHTLIAEDVDNDGDKDLIAYFGYTNSQVTTSELKVFKNNGNGFDPPVIFSYPTNTFKSIKAVDMDNDGDLDFMIYLSSSTAQSPAGLYWIENTNGLGDYSVLHPTNLLLVSSKNFDIGDWNNDGLKDLVYTYRTQIGVRYLRSVTINTDGTLGTPINLPVTGINNTLIKLVDLDNDGDLDILSEFTSGNTYFFWYENLGDGSFTYHSIFDFTIPVNSPNFLEDLNADGKIDFAFNYSDNNSEVAWFQNLGLNYNQIKGNVSLDVDLNGCDQGSIVAQQVLITTTGDNSTISTFTSSNGNYSFKVDAGNYSTAITTAFPYFNAIPNSITSQFNTANGETIANFCLIPSQFFNDLEISFYPLSDARPGFGAQYLLVAKNKGTNPINTTITVQYNNQKIIFSNSSPNPFSQTANSLVYNLVNLQPFATFQATLSFQVNTIPTVTLGEIITFTVDNNLENDITLENNTFQYNQTIVGAYDPNDMLVLEGTEVHIDNSDEYLHYIIRFQNTGNYYAERVLISSLLSENLDWETLELEAYSHANRVEILDGSLLTFIFDAIYLPAITTNEEDSNGFVAFKIKPKSTVVVNDIVNGEASIYFDYNPPIITNEVATTFVSSLNVPEQESNPIYVYPNPVNSLLYVKNIDGNYKAEIYNTIGILISVTENNPSLDFTNLAVGIYIVRITDEFGKTNVLKVIKK